MNKNSVFRTISAVLLVFTGISASFGGYALVTDPTGQNMQMPLSWLERSPFTDYLIPGLVLLIVIGIGSLVAAILVVLRVRFSPRATTAIGVALTIWILAQMIMIQRLSFLQFVFIGLGLALSIIGEAEWRRANAGGTR